MRTWIRRISFALAISLTTTGMLQTAQASLISAEQAAQTVAAESSSAAHLRLAGLLDRQDISDALIARGVDIQQARLRVAAMTNEEAALVAEQIDQAPAGGSDLIGAVVFIFVLLLITDILGLTRVFRFTRPITR